MTPPPNPGNCAAVIPCHNEAAAIGPLVSEIRSLLPNVFVVDDGSADATASIAAAAQASVIRHERNLGKGAALAAGLKTARAQGFAWALLMDGDGQHSPKDIPAFLNAAFRTNAPLIIGNRMTAPRGMPWLRRFVNRWLSARLSTRARRPLPDTQCGFRLVELNAWSRLRLQTTRFEVESEMLLAFINAGLPVEFVPIQLIYKSERSKMNPVIDTWRWFRWWWRASH